MLLYAATIFVSAFLLFLVQPIIAKQILPWFGGSAAVWTTCMVFFQLVLLAGYAYADGLTRLSARTQALVHSTLLVAACAVLPIVADPAWKPGGDGDPSARILLLLAQTIGLPYFLVSTTGPLVQSWYARAHADAARQSAVYRLFALSNLASLLALIAYPFAIEPRVSSLGQSRAWSAGFVVFAALVLMTAWAMSRRTRAGIPWSGVRGTGAGAAPGPSAYALWLALSALGTVFLLGITTHLTQNVASVPFLWIMPLSLYLLTFILCFDGHGWYRRWLFWPVLLALLPAMAWGLVTDRGVLHFRIALALYGAGLFVVCMFCHGELVRAKPAPRWLTRFYLMVALGGALGGLFVGLVAPRVFNGYWELPIALVAGALAAVIVMRHALPALPIAAFASACIAAWFGVSYVQFMRDDALLMRRNFYGTIRVKQTGPDAGRATVRRMMHGVILHGEQYTSGEWRYRPTTYYGETSGAGLALLLARPGVKRVGVVGLGAGTLAAYGKPGDAIRYYEINAQVLDAARRLFTYLEDSKADVRVVLGDARLVLERELEAGQPQGFDVLVVDAFSSDAIPVHLITREALAVYRRHVRPGGVIAFHVTNRYLDLAPVVKQLADEAGMRAVLVSDTPSDDALSSTDYVLVTDNRDFLAEPAVLVRSKPIETIAGLEPWTDDYNNLFRILK